MWDADAHAQAFEHWVGYVTFTVPTLTSLGCPIVVRHDLFDEAPLCRLSLVGCTILDTLGRVVSTLSMHDDDMPGFHLHLFNWNGRVDRCHSPIHKRHIPVCETTNCINPSSMHPAMGGSCGSPLGQVGLLGQCTRMSA